jgi:adenylate kinase
VRIVMLGLPGAGKGTQARRLAEANAVPHVATGDIFRQAMADGSPLGQQVQAVVSRGELVPDALTVAIIRERLARPDAGGGFVLDGFPRTRPQAESLDALLDGGAALEHAVYLEVDVEAVVGRLAGRRVCPRCAATYHVETDPPGPGGTCLRCGATVEQRADDRPEAQRRRVQAYQRDTAPLLPYYAAQAKLVRVVGTGAPDAVAARITAALGGGAG